MVADAEPRPTPERVVGEARPVRRPFRREAFRLEGIRIVPEPDIAGRMGWRRPARRPDMISSDLVIGKRLA
jgi:hypothetical protein